MRTLFGVVWVCAVLTAAAAQGDDLTDQEKAARDFAFEKTKLGISLVDFKKRFPDAGLNEARTDAKLKRVGYVNIADASSASVCGYDFLDNKLYEIQILYRSKKIEKLGGWRVMLEKLTDKFGKCNEGDLDVKSEPFSVLGIWQFPKVDRMITIQVDEKNICITVTDTVLSKELEQRKKKAAKTGFDD